MQRTRKTWGEKHNIFQNDTCEVSVLYLMPWRRCSWHTHQQKYNLFYVLSGKLVIKLEDGKSEVPAGQIFTTSPGEFHEFQTHEEETTCIEVMYVKYDPADISRETLGGKLDPPVDLDFHGVCEICKKKFTRKNTIAGDLDQNGYKVQDLGLKYCDNCLFLRLNLLSKKDVAVNETKDN